MTWGRHIYQVTKEKDIKHDKIKPAARTGLKNLGNTCYMNSIVQCLNNTYAFSMYFVNDAYGDHLNETSPQRSEVAEEVGAVIKALWAGAFKSIAMWDLKAVISRYYKPFLGYDQHDAHEFLIKLLDWLHQDLCKVRMRFPKMSEQNYENVPDYIAAKKYLEEVKRREDSVLRDQFHGLHRSVITCSTCDSRSLTFEPFSVLTVPLPSNNRCSLKDMLNECYRESHIEFKCSKCKSMRNCTRQLDIWKLPPVLIIQLNRFEHDVLMKKKQNYVDFPLENLDLTRHIAASTANLHTTFSLYALSNHYGTIDGGHYTAFCQNYNNKKWYKFDDHEVYELPRESVRTSAAYILFYQAINYQTIYDRR